MAEETTDQLETVDQWRLEILPRVEKFRQNHEQVFLETRDGRVMVTVLPSATYRKFVTVRILDIPTHQELNRDKKALAFNATYPQGKVEPDYVEVTEIPNKQAVSFGESGSDLVRVPAITKDEAAKVYLEYNRPIPNPRVIYKESGSNGREKNLDPQTAEDRARFNRAMKHVFGLSKPGSDELKENVRRLGYNPDFVDQLRTMEITTPLPLSAS